MVQPISHTSPIPDSNPAQQMMHNMCDHICSAINDSHTVQDASRTIYFFISLHCYTPSKQLTQLSQLLEGVLSGHGWSSPMSSGMKSTMVKLIDSFVEKVATFCTTDDIKDAIQNTLGIGAIPLYIKDNKGNSRSITDLDARDAYYYFLPFVGMLPPSSEASLKTLMDDLNTNSQLNPNDPPKALSEEIQLQLRDHLCQFDQSLQNTPYHFGYN